MFALQVLEWVTIQVLEHRYSDALIAFVSLAPKKRMFFLIQFLPYKQDPYQQERLVTLFFEQVLVPETYKVSILA